MVMPSPLLETKLYIPRLRRGLVTRPRLSERLSRGGESKLTLVSAPAGFGKTTLLAEWLAASPADERPTAWLSLDPSDNQAASFWPYLIAALRTVVPEVGATALSLLRVAPGSRSQRSLPRCSTSSALCRTTSCWSSTTTTSSTRTRSMTGWRSCWSTCPHRSTS